MNSAEKIWWFKLFSAIIVAFMTYYLQTYLGLDGLMSFITGVVIFIGISEILGRSNNIDRMRSLRIGWGIFLITWLVVWTILNTLVRFPLS